jgi:hypothetical protein
MARITYAAINESHFMPMPIHFRFVNVAVDIRREQNVCYDLKALKNLRRLYLVYAMA